MIDGVPWLSASVPMFRYHRDERHEERASDLLRQAAGALLLLVWGRRASQGRRCCIQNPRLLAGRTKSGKKLQT